MIEKITGIVIDIIRHSDTSNVVVVYTRNRGRMVFVSPVSNTRGRTSRNARLLPLAVIQADVALTPNREMHRLGSFSLVHPWRDIYLHPVKTVIAIFLREFLSRLLRDSPPDDVLWDFLYTSLREIDESRSDIASLHLRFLSRLLPFMGIQPDVSGYAPGRVFDMRGGIYPAAVPPHGDLLRGADAAIPLLWDAWINDEDVPLAPATLTSVPASSEVNLAAESVDRALSEQNLAAERAGEYSKMPTRRHILDLLLRYYAIHFPGLTGLKSPDILHTTLSAPR